MRLRNSPCEKCGTDTMHNGPTCVHCGTIAVMRRPITDVVPDFLAKVEVSLGRDGRRARRKEQIANGVHSAINREGRRLNATRALRNGGEVFLAKGKRERTHT